jgi:hypothetical protein
VRTSEKPWALSSAGKEVSRVQIKDALQLMLAFGMFVIALIALVVNLLN